MSPARWREVKELFNAAMERAPGEREDYIREVAGGDDQLETEVVSLLASHDDAGTFFEAPLLTTDPLIGRHLGSYQILRRIGSGGMGWVYLGCRADDQFRKRVAIKAVKPELVDAQTLRRFENERYMLAALDHPNIIRLLDAGATEEGLPYLVMDYVEGQSIHEYCDSRNLTTRERLQLFRTVCTAVHYAHQNLVIHRDLKPSNILVTPDGVPKLLDFGIAKLIRPEYGLHPTGLTRTLLQPMTLEYASPEQILGQPTTTASDVYSLGVLLYRLLTGSHPFESTTHSSLELERAICETEPRPPSQVVLNQREGKRPAADAARTLGRDLDLIVLMAMRKEPQRRYASAEHLSQDIQRHLEGRPVAARKDTATYRISRFIARNTALTVVSAAAVILLVALAILDHLHRVRAERRFNDLHAFANFVISDLDPALRDSTIAARKKLVEMGIQYLNGLAAEAGRDRALERDLVRGYLKIADIQGNPFTENLGDFRAAQDSVKKALALAQRIAPSDAENRRDLAHGHEMLFGLLAVMGERGAAEEHYRKAVALGENQSLTAMSLWTKLGYAQGEAGDPGSAAASFRAMLQLAEAWKASKPEDLSAANTVALAKERLAYFSALSGEPSGAVQAIREAIATYERVPNRPPRLVRSIAKAYKALAEVQRWTGALPDALSSCRRSLAMTEALLQKDPKNTQYSLDVQQNLVLLIDLAATSGAHREARAQTARALDLLRPLAADPAASRYALVNYVTLLVTTPYAEFRNDSAAVASARRAAELTGHRDWETLDLLARAYDRAGNAADAVATERRALALLPARQVGRPVSEIHRNLERRLAAFQARPATTP
jgi:serine/threonine protein kinase